MRTHLMPAVLVAFCLTPLSAAAPTARPEDVGLSSERLTRIGDLMQRHIAAKTFAGAVTIVARSGRIAHFETYGLMDIETSRPMQRDAIFRIMSMTKPVVGVATLMLVEEGKVRLTDPVSRFIPELRELSVAAVNGDGRIAPAPSGAVSAPRPTRLVAADREVSVRDLLTHTSGLMSGGVSAGQTGDVMPKAGETVAQVMPRLKNVPLDFQPGTRWAYSPQFGFDVLVRVVEIASGMPFDQFARQRIFEPLGMKDTSFYPAAGNPRVATLYESAGGALRRTSNPAFMNGVYLSGGGGLYSTAEDYLQFALMLLDKGQLDGRRLLSARSVEVMASVFAPDTLPGRLAGEGFGLSVRVVDDPAGAQHLPVEGGLRMERRVQHALLHRPDRARRGSVHDADRRTREPRPDPRRLRDRGDAIDHQQRWSGDELEVHDPAQDDEPTTGARIARPGSRAGRCDPRWAPSRPSRPSC